ncbi:MAG: hypothetical protein B7Z71_12065, partial [Acidocella sp. 21-58-7]
MCVQLIEVVIGSAKIRFLARDPVDKELLKPGSLIGFQLSRAFAAALTNGYFREMAQLARTAGL